jgi:hypothetical protein
MRGQCWETDSEENVEDVPVGVLPSEEFETNEDTVQAHKTLYLESGGVQVLIKDDVRLHGDSNTWKTGACIVPLKCLHGMMGVGCLQLRMARNSDFIRISGSSVLGDGSLASGNSQNQGSLRLLTAHYHYYEADRYSAAPPRRINIPTAAPPPRLSGC